jgi:hypothetical protein
MASTREQLIQELDQTPDFVIQTPYYKNKRSYLKAIAIQTQSLLIWKQTRDSYDHGNDSNTQKGRTPPV